MTPAAPPAPVRPGRAPLQRPRECVLGGVCESLARHLGVSVLSMRWLAVGLAFCGGAGLLLYLWLWALVPLERADFPREVAGVHEAPGRYNVPGLHGAGVHRGVPVAWLLLAVAAVSAGFVLVLTGQDASNPDANVAIPLVTAAVSMIACAAGAVAWEQFVDVSGTARPRSASVIRILAGVLLLGVALLQMFASGSHPVLELLLVLVTLLAGLVVLLGPWGLRLWQEVIAERTKRVREEQRAEIAAHLHDSVLQTLALIQNRAGASSEVARIARAQERELREWLYAGGGPVEGDLGSELRDFAAALELDYPVHIEVITVGGSVGSPSLQSSNGEVAAAVREAMLNAARHAGGDVSVYLEGSASALDVFVRDRGAGFDPAAVPADRLGVRESIVGRMRRAGGRATVAPGAGGVGTEVHVHIERQSTGSERSTGSENARPQKVAPEGVEPKGFEPEEKEGYT
ncbi:PspC domain-containing protein [Rathayibacter soli]|uniref:PspC domain-containing protein n=1 Tax=Rathayibacter soli TaxID=3144168 RepID=UPI0027E4BAC9|nr:PspC domain-containing protein [Glaciibacter superstes]